MSIVRGGASTTEIPCAEGGYGYREPAHPTYERIRMCSLTDSELVEDRARAATELERNGSSNGMSVCERNEWCANETRAMIGYDECDRSNRYKTRAFYVSPASLSDCRMIISLTALNTAAILSVSVAHVMCVYTILSSLWFLASNCVFRNSEPASYVFSPS